MVSAKWQFVMLAAWLLAITRQWVETNHKEKNRKRVIGLRGLPDALLAQYYVLNKNPSWVYGEFNIKNHFILFLQLNRIEQIFAHWLIIYRNVNNW